MTLADGRTINPMTGDSGPAASQSSSPSGNGTDGKSRFIATVASWLQLFARDSPLGSVTEIRALNCSTPSYKRPHTRAGWVDPASESHLRDVVRTALDLSHGKSAKGVYFTLNPVSRDLLSRRANRIDVSGAGDATTADRDILRRLWLLIDADPIRTSGVSASDAEKALAREAVDAIAADLHSRDWPAPIVADSGNGWHLLYRIDLPNDDASTALIRNCLRAVAAKFNSPAVEIDRSVFNASRICKLYGSMSRKGDHTPERPHRKSQIVSIPADLAIVPAELLQALAAEAPPELPAVRSNRSSLAIASPANARNVLERARTYLSRVDPAVAGQHGHDQAFHAAGLLTHGFALSVDDALPLFSEWNAGCEPPWTESELLRKLEESDKAPGERGYLLGTGNGNGQSPTPSLASLMELSGLAEMTAEAGITLRHHGETALATAGPAVTISIPPTSTALTVADSTPSGDVVEADDDPHRLARLFVGGQCIRDGNLVLRYWRESFWRFGGRAYVKMPNCEIRAEISNCIKSEFDRINLERQSWAPAIGKDGMPVPPPKTQKVTTALVTNVLQAITGITLLSERIEQPSWLNAPHKDPHNFVSLANGILDVQALLAGRFDTALVPHSPLWFSTICLPFDFQEQADCPLWRNFVAHNLEGDQERIDLLQEWFGYCLTVDTSLQKFMILEGEGSNGKSVVCAALSALLGLENVCHVPLEVWGKDFVLTQTLGKLANIASEVGDLDKIAEGYLKSFVSGDRMTFNRKNQSLIESTPTARLLIATNNRPRFGDRSGGIWRRMLLLPFRVQVAEHEKVYGMDQATWWHKRGELPGIFLWALNGLASLRAKRRFTEPAVCREAIDDYRSENNPARQFLLENFEAGEEANEIITSDVYKAYSDWCERNGYRRLASRQFGKEIVRVFPKAKNAKVWESSRRVNGYKGISIKSQIASDTSDTSSVDDAF